MEKTEFETLLDKTPDYLKQSSEEDLYNYGQLLPYSQRVTFDYRIDCINNDTSFQENYAMIMHETTFIGKLIKNDELRYIIDNIEDIFRGNDSLKKDHDRLLKYLKYNSYRLGRDEYNKLELLVAKCISDNFNIIKDEDIEKIRDLLVKTANDERRSILDIRKEESGSYSKTYTIGNSIIKVGHRRLCDEIPDNNRLLIPSFKGTIGKDIIEITDRLFVHNKVDIDNIYKVYKELREQGVMWLDPTVDNLGILSVKTANKQNEMKKVSHEDYGIRYNPNYKNRELKPGELVIIDLDHMTLDDDEEKMNEIKDTLPETILSRLELFDKQYKEEKGFAKKIGTM